MIQNINLGAAPNDKTGTKARVAGQMINANFAYLEGKIDNKSYLKLETGFTLLAQDLTLNADWEWLINGVEYTNPVAVVVAIPLAAAGKSRIDLIVCNSSNTFNRVAGVESVSTPVAPALPTNTIMATFFTVSDGIVSVPEVPSSGTDESTSNKSQDVETDKLSVTKYPSVKALYDWAVGKFQLTETTFGTFANSLTAKETLVDADEVVSDDSADGAKAKKTSWLNVWTNYIKVKTDALYHQGTVTTNTIPKATGTRTIGNSQISDNGTNVGIGTTTPAQKLYVNGGNIGVTYTDGSTGVSRNFTIGSKTGFTGLVFDGLDSGTMNFIGNAINTVTRFLNKGILRCTGESTANYIQIQNNDVNSVISNSGVGSIVLQANSGNVLVNTTTNNGVDKLQVNGTISATAASTASQVVIKSQLDAKSNTALTVRKISTATTLAESDNGTVILLTASCMVTLPNALSLGFNCSFVTSAGVTMTYALGGSIVLINNAATTMAEKLSHTITNTGVLNEYITVGL